MIESISVRDITGARVLVTRESALALRGSIERVLQTHDRTGIHVDFSGIGVVTPSYTDALLLLVEDLLNQFGIPQTVVALTHLPDVGSVEKYEAIGRAHDSVLSPEGSHGWALTIHSRRTGAPGRPGTE